MLQSKIKPSDKQSRKLTRTEKSCQLNSSPLKKVLERGKEYSSSIQNANNSSLEISPNSRSYMRYKVITVQNNERGKDTRRYVSNIQL